MLRKLRIKFIALNMATVAVVLAAVFTSICVITYQQDISQVNEQLNHAIVQASGTGSHGWKDAMAADGGLSTEESGEEAGTESNSPDGANPAGTSADNAADPSTSDAASPAANAAQTTQASPTDPSADDPSSGTPPMIGRRDEGEKLIPIAVYSIQSDGSSQAASPTNTASISDEVLSNATSELMSAEDGVGTLPDLGLLYAKRTFGDTAFLAFADSSAASGWQKLALVLVAVGAATLLVFFVISVFFSRWALRPVARAWESQRRFVADASHDLKTPLTVILANTSILMEHPERSIASQSQWLESTQHEAKAMQGLVEDLLLIAKMDEEQDAEERTLALGAGSGSAQGEAAAVTSTSHTIPTVDFSDLVEGELLQFESVAFERGITLDSDIEEGLQVAGIEARLRRLLDTLIDNACKYADERGRVLVAAHPDAKRRSVLLSVYNTGPAISPDDLPHVFDRFYRADESRTRSGHGLGLAIARAIAEEHGGALSVESSTEDGTTFTATLPLARA